MAKISEKNKRFRDKQQIITDLKKILAMDIHYGTKYDVLHEITWGWTEFYGKYVGCTYWSEKAVEKFEKKNDIPNFSCDKMFRHDH